MTEKRNKPISRREALKAIGAVTGVTVLSAARGDWETPLVQVGALPAHAQGSGGRLQVFNLTSAPIYVTIGAAAPMKAAVNGVCEGTKINSPLDEPPKNDEVFPLAPGYYDVTSCAPGNCGEANSTKLGQPVVEGQTTIVTFSCPS